MYFSDAEALFHSTENKNFILLSFVNVSKRMRHSEKDLQIRKRFLETNWLLM